VKTARAGEQLLDGIRTMDRGIVQEHDEMAADLVKKMTQEDRCLFPLDVVLKQKTIGRAS